MTVYKIKLAPFSAIIGANSDDEVICHVANEILSGDKSPLSFYAVSDDVLAKFASDLDATPSLSPASTGTGDVQSQNVPAASFVPSTSPDSSVSAAANKK